MASLLPKIEQFTDSLKEVEIQSDRKTILNEFSSYLQSRLSKKEEINLNFICTHNSRRSQLCQVWAQAFAHYFEIGSIKAFSGGTETTAFHPNAVGALKDAGFEVIKTEDGENPVYQIGFSEEGSPITCSSKLYHEAVPASKSFVAVLTCSDAEANCPFIPEAEARFAIKYVDPKKADGTPQQNEVYRQRNRQIASEMHHVFSQLKSS